VIDNRLIFHTLKARGYDVLPGLKFVNQATTIKIQPKPELIKCSVCGCKEVVRKGSKNRLLRAGHMLNDRPVYLDTNVPIVYCPKCDIERQIDPVIADPKKHYTHGFANYVLQALMTTSVKGVASLFTMSWNTVNSILKDFLKKKFSNISLSNITKIAIDELHIGTRNKFITIVMDLNSDDPIFVGEGKAKSALEPFWEKLGPIRRRKIACVAIDMGAAYQAAVRENLPNAKIVFDHFHVVKLANETVDAVRRQQCAIANASDKNFFSGVRFILLKNNENLDASKGEPGKLKRLLKVNEDISAIYILKEDLRQIWNKRSKAEAESTLNNWLSAAMESENRIIKRLAGTIDKYREGILNFYDFKISTGPLEGVNRRIRAQIGQAYGYRDMELFKLLILAIRLFNPGRNRAVLR
jgi:transposase